MPGVVSRIAQPVILRIVGCRRKPAARHFKKERQLRKSRHPRMKAVASTRKGRLPFDPAKVRQPVHSHAQPFVTLSKSAQIVLGKYA
jgi:cytochrome c556